MNDLIEMQSQIRKFFLSSKKLRTPEKYIGVELKKIGGLSNVNYIAVVKDMSTNGKIAKVLFRKFGALSEGANHELEKEITNYLAKKGMGPKFLYEEPNGKYRIVEFLDNTITIPRTQGLDPKILNKLFPIINAYSLISYTYKYTIKGDNINFTVISS